MSETNGPKSNISSDGLEDLLVLQPLSELVGDFSADQERTKLDDMLTPLVTELGEHMCLVWKEPDKRTYQLFYLENEACFNC